MVIAILGNIMFFESVRLSLGVNFIIGHVIFMSFSCHVTSFQVMSCHFK
jgi:hypothetical protein